MSGSWDWSKPWRDVKRFGEDIYNGMNSWYDSNRKYLPKTGAYGQFSGMSSGGSGLRFLNGWASQQFNRKWDESHGADRYWLSQFPLYGWLKQLQGKADYYEDYYRHTGVDPKYPQVYGGSAGGLLGDFNKQTTALQPKKWARDLETMFAPQYEEILTREKAFSKGYW